MEHGGGARGEAALARGGRAEQVELTKRDLEICAQIGPELKARGYGLEDGKVRAMDIKAGDTILFSKYAGTEIKIEGEDHLILREEDVLGIIEK